MLPSLGTSKAQAYAALLLLQLLGNLPQLKRAN